MGKSIILDYIHSNINEENKLKVTSMDIIVEGILDKPYYSLKYVLAENGECHIGYSSYILKNVYDWKNNYFELVEG